ncbi:BQ2448_2034 [Microbotryum intermedium]|uniref:BQ2448_2034 protein n=1 Tax=Microbotryum intermedium TaxID=269621 RepID=A0A238FAU9_9BASI|nr:BQ2448_2034 [Microbotryum intermedium]
MPLCRSGSADLHLRYGRQPAVYNSWPETEAQVKGYSGAEPKKF